ncbi:MAG: hypothetical protein JNL30_19010 [Rubrivivax sp.]|nr:hypothetical protein [Rubrivivax sp.]
MHDDLALRPMSVPMWVRMWVRMPRRGPGRVGASPAATRLAAYLLAAGCAWTAGCAVAPPAPGQPRDALLARWGTPTARYALPAPTGGERLEYASGPFGRTTWMVDLDAAGRVMAARQVLNEAHFAEFSARAQGINQAELLRTLGRPGERHGAGIVGGEIWSWRYPTNDCLWFQVSIDTAADRVRSAGYGIDWHCDAGSGDRS